MADENGPGGAAQGDSVDLSDLFEAGLIAERRPIAAIPLHTSLGVDELTVVCDDGACFRRCGVSREWVEMEPVPGTARAMERE